MTQGLRKKSDDVTIKHLKEKFSGSVKACPAQKECKELVEQPISKTI